jgi:transposase-like protein
VVVISEKRRYTISELSRFTGIDRHVLYNWKAQGWLIPVNNTKHSYSMESFEKAEKQSLINRLPVNSKLILKRIDYTKIKDLARLHSCQA